jgi:hypothetical protein
VPRREPLFLPADLNVAGRRGEGESQALRPARRCVFGARAAREEQGAGDSPGEIVSARASLAPFLAKSEDSTAAGLRRTVPCRLLPPMRRARMTGQSRSLTRETRRPLSALCIVGLATYCPQIADFLGAHRNFGTPQARAQPRRGRVSRRRLSGRGDSPTGRNATTEPVPVAQCVPAAKNLARQRRARQRSGPRPGAYPAPSFCVGARCAIAASIVILFPPREHIVEAASPKARFV